MKRLKKLAGFLLASLLLAQAAPLSVSAGGSFNEFAVRGKNGLDLRLEGEWTTALQAAEASPRSVYTITDQYIDDIFLTDFTLDLSGRDFLNFLALEPGAEVNLYLKGTNRITAGKGRAGITVPRGATVNILGTGSLTIAGGEGGAGIGGDRGMSAGTVVIGEQWALDNSSFPFTATGGLDAAGIGGGSGGSGGDLTVWGGLITAKGGGSAQDIGAGKGGTPWSTRIYGGRLVNYANIGWTPEDSAARQQVRVRVDSPDVSWQTSVDAFSDSFNTVYTSLIPTGKGGYEHDIAYLYVPAALKELKLLLVPSKASDAESFVRMTDTYDIPANGEIRVRW